jgi:sugar-specific transcriptional regulator TrmB
MYEESLKQSGLSPDQARVYEALLKNGPLPAGKVSAYASLKRGLTYKILEQLEAAGLVAKKEEKGKVATFEPAHPLRLKEIAETKEKDAKNAQVALEGVLGGLISDFNLVSGKPGIQYLEGIDGLKRIYDDIIETKQDILLIRSIYDDKYPQIEKLVNHQIARQVKSSIHVRALTPLVEETIVTVVNDDEKNLVERRIIPKEKFSLAAQVIIYSNKVAITNLKEKFVSTLVENSDIAETFKTIFEYMWMSSTQEHEKIYKEASTDMRDRNTKSVTPTSGQDIPREPEQS